MAKQTEVDFIVERERKSQKVKIVAVTAARTIGSVIISLAKFADNFAYCIELLVCKMSYGVLRRKMTDGEEKLLKSVVEREVLYVQD